MNARLYFLLLGLFLINYQNAKAQYQNTRVTLNDSDQSETSIAVSPLNSNLLMSVWNDFQYSQGANEIIRGGFGFSTDGGNTWSTSILDRSDYPSAWECDPSAQIDTNGNAFFCYLMWDPDFKSICVSKTTDYGINWVHKEICRDSNESEGGLDKPFMVVDNNTNDSLNGRIYFVWTNLNYPNSIWFSFSRDHGESFSAPLELDSVPNAPGIAASLAPVSEQGTLSLPLLQFSMPVVAPNGDVYVTWMDVESSSYNGSLVKLRKSTNGGATFQSITNGPSFGRIVGQDIGDARVSNSPSLVVGTDNALYLTYDDWDSSGTYALRVKFAKSTNSGLSWNNTRTIGRIAEGKQFFPSITIDTRNRGNAPLLV